MPRKPRRRFLKKKEKRKLLKDFSQSFGIDLEQLLRSDKMEAYETEVTEIFIFDKKPLLARSGNDLFPTLVFDDFLTSLSRIVIDMGAIPNICKGADIMAPGIVSLKGKFKKNNLLLAVDERYGKPLAVGIALFNSNVARKMKHGKIVKNIHYIGDKVWSHIKEIQKKQ